MTDSNAILTEMNDRSREFFRRVVEGYLDNGEPKSHVFANTSWANDDSIAGLQLIVCGHITELRNLTVTNWKYDTTAIRGGRSNEDNAAR